ncbi:hypothetical protein [Pelosinus sp. sgz500959]|uniref:hypothetical protein n=1 Tax=Pelosinus sp. sgz500959 TaxID=3242472 RepID=UPI00366D1583
MWFTISEMVGIVCAVILCSISVKLVDDFLDYDLDSCTGCYNFTTILGKGTLVYGMLALALSASINASVSMPLFLSSYIVGMFKDEEQVFPSRFSGLQESLFVFILGILVWDWKSMLFSLFFVVSIQLFDDYIDIHTDQLAGYRNLAYRLGKIECLLLSILTILLSWWIEEHMFPVVFLGTAIFYSTLLYYQRRSLSC